MTSRLNRAFANARAENRAALVTYLCAGDPTLALTPQLLCTVANAGADVLEVGMPFSDPTADGPTIQRASERALASGTTFAGVLDAIRVARRSTEAPIVLFGYYNPILRYGEAKLARDAKEAGVDGLLVVDLPVDVARLLLDPLREQGLDFIPLVAPTSTPSRVRLAGEAAGSFIYCVSMTGVTGSSGAPLEAAAKRAADIRAHTHKPVAVGFGVRNADDVRVIAPYADGVVVGSALVRAVHEAEDKLDAADRLVRALSEGCRRPSTSSA